MSNHRFRQQPELRLTSIQDAAAFVDDVGLCPFQGERAGLPTFYGAVAGREGTAPRWGEADRDYDRAWSWKDRLFSQGKVYYGKPLGDFRMLISRRLLPYVSAACAPGAAGAADDYLGLYEDGLLGYDAKQLYEALLEAGPASTTRLRQAAKMKGRGEEWRRFERALTELQRAFLVAPVGIDKDNRWKYTFRYAPLHVAFPEETARTCELSSRAAMTHLLLHYVRLVGPVKLTTAARLFGWSVDRLAKVAGKLQADGCLAVDGEGSAAALRANG
ncbi:MAG TPA: crosslink repair DNA glycosylase YcaQ family protein [Chloroflexota bacterium]|nr:crosslink repair DNA glycosylase YcaQ family protein [Chloroflexota bacterium]